VQKSQNSDAIFLTQLKQTKQYLPNVHRPDA